MLAYSFKDIFVHICSYYWFSEVQELAGECLFVLSEIRSLKSRMLQYACAMGLHRVSLEFQLNPNFAKTAWIAALPVRGHSSCETHTANLLTHRIPLEPEIT